MGTVTSVTMYRNKTVKTYQSRFRCPILRDSVARFPRRGAIKCLFKYLFKNVSTFLNKNAPMFLYKALWLFQFNNVTR